MLCKINSRNFWQWVNGDHGRIGTSVIIFNGYRDILYSSSVRYGKSIGVYKVHSVDAIGIRCSTVSASGSNNCLGHRIICITCKLGISRRYGHNRWFCNGYGLCIQTVPIGSNCNIIYSSGQPRKQIAVLGSTCSTIKYGIGVWRIIIGSIKDNLNGTVCPSITRHIFLGKGKYNWRRYFQRNRCLCTTSRASIIMKNGNVISRCQSGKKIRCLWCNQLRSKFIL